MLTEHDGFDLLNSEQRREFIIEMLIKIRCQSIKRTTQNIDSVMMQIEEAIDVSL